MDIILAIIFLLLTPYERSISSINDNLVQSINNVRVVNNLPTLQEDYRLDKSAQIKACDMYNNNYWSHLDLKGQHSWHLIKEQGYFYIYAGEIMAKNYYGTEVLEAWLNSPSHRIEIFKPYEDIGVGKCGNITVVHFATD